MITVHHRDILIVQGLQTNFSPKSINVTDSVGDPGCLSRIPDLNFSIPDPGSGYFHPGSRIWIRNTELIMYFKYFKTKQNS
jgi:hypothetical protein